jgi:hypothetical protein
LVPAGYVLQSPDDAVLVSTILSTHDDGSAAVLVVAGQTTVDAASSSVLRLQAVTAFADTPLTASAIGAVVNSVSVSFGSPYGTAAITDFSRPERIWWTNSRVICARYRIQPQSLSGSALEVVIDIHAYAGGRALVEVVVENGKIDTVNATTASVPAAATYNAIVSINGAVAATVDSTHAVPGETGHSAFRAWHASHWVGGDPGLRVNQATADLQSHPLLFKCDQAGTDQSAYASDAYVPFGHARLPASGMGGTGDAPFIGPLTLWQAQFLQTGDYRTANAVEVSTLAALGYNVNYRDRASGLVPDASLLRGKYQTGSGKNWPVTNADQLGWELAHHPAAGLMAFICRPSPVYIEIAQKICVWNGTFNADRGGLTYGWNGPNYGISDFTGVFGASSQLRGRAWGMRSLAHATFLSPDDSAWKSGGRYWLNSNRAYMQAFMDDPLFAALHAMWYGGPNQATLEDQGSGPVGAKTYAPWMYHFLVAEVAKIANARLLTGNQQTSLESVADAICLQPVRYVNEQPNGGWRFHPYRQRLGDSTGNLVSYANWGTERNTQFSGAPSSVAGRWGGGFGDESTWAAVEALGFPNSAQGDYPSAYWAALVAAVERGVAGASTAWATVQNNVTNLPTWRTGFASDPRWGAAPRNI